MDKDDDVFETFEQIDQLSESKPICWFLDVVCTPEQSEEAKLIAKGLATRIQEKNPNMPEKNIVVGITNTDTDLPAKKRLDQLSNFIKGRNRRKK
jgi:hypothetical protein